MRSVFLTLLGTLQMKIVIVTIEIQVVMEVLIMNLESGLNFLQHREVVNI